MDHPAVAQVVTFAMPHDKLGEEVACAVVLREGMVVVEQRDPHLRRRPARRLQGAAQGGDPGGDPEGCDRQAAAHRPRAEARPRRVKICIYGAGAIGGLMGARLAKAGAEVSLIARGPHLAAMREKGLTLRSAEETFTVHPTVTDDPMSLGPQDYVVITLKAHQVPGVVGPMQPMLGPDDRRGDGRERRALVVLLPPRRPVRGAPPAQRRPRRRAVERHRPAARDRLRRLPGGRSARAGCDRAGRGRPLHPGRALGREDGAHRAPVAGADRRRPQGADPHQDPRRDLDQALGQPLLQPDQRARPVPPST